MITAQFGAKKFSVAKNKIYTPEGVSITESIDIEETEVSGKKPLTKVKGIKLQEVSFDVKLDNRFVNIETEVRWWKSKLLSKSSEYLIIGAYRIGAFFLTQYELKDIVTNKDGKYISVTLSLSFKENGTFALNKTINFQSKQTKIGSISSIAINFRVGSTIKPKKGTRRYGNANNALKKKGKSTKNTIIEHKITAIHSGKKAVKIKGTETVTKNKKKTTKTYIGWIRVEDMSVVTY